MYENSLSTARISSCYKTVSAAWMRSIAHQLLKATYRCQFQPVLRILCSTQWCFAITTTWSSIPALSRLRGECCTGTRPAVNLLGVSSMHSLIQFMFDRMLETSKDGASKLPLNTSASLVCNTLAKYRKLFDLDQVRANIDAKPTALENTNAFFTGRLTSRRSKGSLRCR